MKTLVTIAILVGLLIASAGVAAAIWYQLGDVEMSIHGYIALGLGAFFSLALGGGLMFLVFYSNRHGHDDDVGQ
ncbi:MAG: hypothetical protein AAF495_24090 [Pseudomonadota bacterium]